MNKVINVILQRTVLTIGTSSRHGDRVSKVHQESAGVNFRQVENKISRKRIILPKEDLL